MKNTKSILSAASKIAFALFVILFAVNPAIAFGSLATSIKLGTVSATLDPSDLTFGTQEEHDMSKFIYEKVFADPQLTEIHDIVQGVVHDKEIVLMKRLGLVGKKAVDGDCAPATNTGKLKPTTKTWQPKYITDRFQECWAKLYDTFVKYQMKANAQKPDISDTAWIKFIEDMLVNDTLPEAIFRIVWFGDTSADEVAPYGSGELTGGTDVDFFNPIDGIWKQLFAITTATPARRVTISKNAQATYTLQEFDTTDTTNKVASGIFRDLINKADSRLRGQKNAIIICTDSLALQYENELEAGGVSASFEMITDGVKVMKRKGVTIIAFGFWDRYIRQYYDDGTAYLMPHRALFTVKENIPVGVEELGSLKELSTYYDPKEKDYTIDMGFTIDAKVLEDYMVQVAH